MVAFIDRFGPIQVHSINGPKILDKPIFGTNQVATLYFRMNRKRCYLKLFVMEGLALPCVYICYFSVY